jgi:DNA-binding transcriptional regulator YiaG
MASNHPNRGPKGPAANPTPDEIKEARAKAGLTQAQAAAVVSGTEAAWRAWESGIRRMHPGLWELFKIKAPST